MKIPIELIGGAGFFPARKPVAISVSRSRVSSYEEELDILGIEADSSCDLLAIILAIETRWILGAAIKWKDVGLVPKKNFLATYQGIELFMSVDADKNELGFEQKGVIRIGRIIRGSAQNASSLVLLVREIYMKEGGSVFRKNYHYR